MASFIMVAFTQLFLAAFDASAFYAAALNIDVFYSRFYTAVFFAITI